MVDAFRSLDVVHSFKHLGTVLQDNGRHLADARSKVASAHRAYAPLAIPISAAPPYLYQREYKSPPASSSPRATSGSQLGEALTNVPCSLSQPSTIACPAASPGR